jgi:hypothetical protein
VNLARLRPASGTYPTVKPGPIGAMTHLPDRRICQWMTLSAWPSQVGCWRNVALVHRPDAQNLRMRCGRATPELNWLKLLADRKPEAVNSVGAVAPLCLVSF